jgi:hypothetical protein
MSDKKMGPKEAAMRAMREAQAQERRSETKAKGTKVKALKKLTKTVARGR